MNKIVIGAVIVGFLAVGSFTVYNVVNNNKVEQEQTAIANNAQAKAEVAEKVEETPVANQKNDAGEYVNDPDEGVKIHDFFLECMQYSFNVKDTANVPTEVTDFQAKSFAEEYIPTINNFYKAYKSLELIDCTVINVKKTTIICLDGTKLAGYAIEYTANFKDENGDTNQFKHGEQNYRAIISTENGKFLLENLDSQIKED